MWHEPAHRVALLELLQTGSLQKRVAQSVAWQELLQLGWTRRTRRQDQLALVPRFRSAVEQVLDGSWPDWRSCLDKLTERNLPPTESGLLTLLREQRLQTAVQLPQRVNQRTAAAAIGEHSKARLGDSVQQSLQTCEVTSDYVVRLRGCGGLSLTHNGKIYDASMFEKVQGELLLSERGFLDGTTIHGTPAALLFVENVGPFVDLNPQAGWLLVHVPGWNTHAAKRLFEQYPEVPALHFGDLDPEGLQIFRHLRQTRPDLRWVVPDWIFDYVMSHGLPKEWPDTLEVADAPPVIRKLAEQRRWVEQEALVFDDRLWPALHEIASRLDISRRVGA